MFLKCFICKYSVSPWRRRKKTGLNQDGEVVKNDCFIYNSQILIFPKEIKIVASNTRIKQHPKIG